MIDIFKQCRESVTAEAVAKLYGIEFDHQGKTAQCPFHPDRHPSMTFKNGRYRCWACSASGNSIDFTAELLNLTPLDAVKRLNTDFCLGLPLDRQQTPAERREANQEVQRRRELSDTAKAFEQWCGTMLDKLTAVFRTAHLALKDCQGLDTLTDAEVLAVKWQATFEYWADCLMSSDMSVQMDVFRARKEVDTLCSQVLSNLSRIKMKSDVA